jgi:glycosyltransferase involved in cell wall biosynthesis/Tfp pilus assembly protein PilF
MMLNYNQSKIKKNKRILKKNPDSLEAQEARLNLGVFYFKNRDFEKALMHLSKADNMSECNLGIKKMLGIVYFSMHNYHDAKEIFEKILEKDDADAEACRYLAQIHVTENEHRKGIEFLKHASQIDPNNAEVWNDLGALCFSVRDFDEAERFLLEAIEQDDGYALPYLNLMDVYLKRGNTEAAKRVVDDFVQIFPDHPAGAKYLGIVCRLEGSFYEAIRHLLVAMDRDHDDVEIPYNLGLAFMSTADFESAKDFFETCLAIVPNYGPAKDKLAVCYCKLEGADRAFRILKTNTADVDWEHKPREYVDADKAPEKISILVPAFNEADRILSNTREIRKHVAGLGYDFEIIIVDDGSDDDTYEILELLSRTIKDVRPYRSTLNKGKGMALREASLKAKGDLIVFLDADLELHPRLIKDMLDRMKAADADVVLGSKRHPDSKLRYPWRRRILSNLYYLVNKVLFGIPVKDTQTGIKVFKKEVLDRVIPKLIEKEYAFDLELIVNVHALGYKIIEAPIVLDYARKFGRIGGRAFVRTAIDTLAIYYRLKILKYYDRKQLPLTTFPKVSIIIPFKQGGPYVHQAVQHCLELDYPDFEIILLPDTPMSPSGNHRVKIITTGAKPPSEKRDIGARQASGEILAFLDDDAYPERNWLKSVVRNFSDPQVAAVGGPALTPDEDNFWQQLSGSIFSSVLVSGRYNYRYVIKTFQDVDDYPSCNLSVRKNSFEMVGGFDTSYWPGEDTVLCLKIVKELKKKIVYDPDAAVFHHRRELFVPHLKQVKSYALHRGFFVKKYPETSRKLCYFVPSVFAVGFVGGLVGSFFYPMMSTGFIALAGLYFALTAMSQILTLSPRRFFWGTMGIFLTHMTYGIYFLKGLSTRDLPR